MDALFPAGTRATFMMRKQSACRHGPRTSRRRRPETVYVTTMLVALGSLAALAARGWAWHKWAPRSFWYAVEFPARRRSSI
ncbi:hypothetical protein Airi02_012980 [Actinoallomurus iriomotensis]|uniref:Uncharacterized protein n=1 Tax=Actinoallomurus iriomotensis TaxID=478107 RepID=A0A9W6RXE3_9ACTN|nr:hypothetical protein Airi02_012980 [Actinoallomurus iriomotensis]